MSERSHVYSSCFCRQSSDSAAGSDVMAAPASTIEWTSKSVPYASKTYPRMVMPLLAARARSANRGGATRAYRLATSGRALDDLGLETSLDEAVLEEPLGVQEGQRARSRTQHDHQELLTAAPCGHRQVVARLVGEAGLERLHPTRIVEERNVTRVHASAVDERLSSQQRPRHRVVLQQPRRQLRHVARVAALGRVRQAVRVCEPGRGQAELPALGV